MTRRPAVLALVVLAASCGSTPPIDRVPAAVPVPRTTLEASVTDTTGTSHTLAESLDAGRRVALVFWQPWCTGCRSEASSSRRAHATLSSTTDVLGVVSGPTGAVDEDDVTRAILEWPIPYTVLRDRDLVLTDAFGVEITPTIVIVEPDGVVSYRGHTPPEEWRD